MNEKSKAFAAVLAVCIGVLYVLLGVTFLASPLKGLQDYSLVLPSFAAAPVTYVLYAIEAALIGVLALGFVPIITEYVGLNGRALFRWMMYLGLLGFAVEAVDQFRTLNLLPFAAGQYNSGDAALQRAIIATQQLRYIDTTCIFRFGFVGLWILTLNIIALQLEKLKRIVCILGIVGGCLLLVTMIGNLMASTLLMSIGAMTAIIIAPIWYIWTGIGLRRS